MKIAEIIKGKSRMEMTTCNFFYTLNFHSVNQAEAEILALIPANMEIPPYFPGSGIKTEERRNLILGRNAGLDEVRKAMGVKNGR